MVTGLQEGQQRGGDGRHARREDQTVLALLQGAQLLDHGALVEGVEVTLIGRLFGVEVLVRGRCENGGVERPSGTLGLLSGMDAQRVNVHET